MKVLLVDKFAASTVEQLRALGFQVTHQPDLRDAALAEELATGGIEALVVRSTKVTQAVLEKAGVALVVRAGSGFDNIDVKAASNKGIYVATCPGKNSAAVAELAVGLMVALDRRIADNVAELRAGRWEKKRFSQARGLRGRTLGVLGLGSIGQLVVSAAQGLGMNVVAWSAGLTARDADALGVEPRALAEDVAAVSDVVSVHLPLTPETRGLCGPGFFSVMRPGTLFINTSRGEIVDELALRQAMDSRGIRAGLDVYNGEPAAGSAAFEHPLAAHPNVYGTHHIGASTEQAQEAIANEMVHVLQAYRDTGRVPNVVNLSTQSVASYALVVRHHDRVGVLAHVLTGLRSGGINVQEMENVVFDGAQAAIARIHLDRAPSAQVLEDIQKGSADIMELKLIGLRTPATDSPAA